MTRHHHHHHHRLPALLAVLVALALLAACGGGRGTPRAAYDSLRSALATGDAAALYALHDGESRAFYRRHVRGVRARLDRGDAPAEVLPSPDQGPELFLEGDEHAAVVRFVGRYADVAQSWGWLADAVIVDEPAVDDEHAVIRVRGLNGVEQDLHFVREPAGWAYDAYRQYRESTDGRGR